MPKSVDASSSISLKVGYDFMCSGQQHHTYHVGALINQYIGALHLHKSCDFDSRLRELIGADELHFRYSGRPSQILSFLRNLADRRQTAVIVGIKSKWIPLIAILSLFGRRIEIHLHGQIAGMVKKHKKFFWYSMSFFVKFVVANPIYGGPKFVKPIGNIGAFDFLPAKSAKSRHCLLYGGNKAFLHDEKIARSIQEAGYTVSRCLASNDGYVEINSIIRSAEKAIFTYVSLDYAHYKLSPSGRICDLRILRLVPLVGKTDFDTQAILTEYGIPFELVSMV
jgi:hypothetical protein